MIRIVIHPGAEIKTRSGTGAKTGKPYSIREQQAWAYLFDGNGQMHPHPSSIKVGLDMEQASFEPGEYTLAPQSMFVDRYGSLQIGRVKLVKKPVAAAKAA